MPWVRLDDGFYDHEKFTDVGPIGLALWVTALAYCNRNLTDGKVTRPAVKRLLDFDGVAWRMWQGELVGGGEDVDPIDVAEELVRVGLFDRDGKAYRIHDYHDYQPTAEQIREDRAKTAARVAKWRDRHRNGVTNTVTNDVSNTVSSGGVTGAPTPTPTPTTGLSKEGGQRNETLPPTLARCTAHQGVIQPPNCRGCMKAREDAEEVERRQNEELRRMREECIACGGDGWATDREGNVLGRCNHGRTA